MKFTTYSATILTVACVGAFARPAIQTSLPLPACVTECINSVAESGGCSGDDVSCICSNAAFNPCIQKGCPPSLVDPAGQWCSSASSSGTTTLNATPTSSSSAAVTQAATTVSPPGTASTSVTFIPSSVVSPHITIPASLTVGSSSSTASHTSTKNGAVGAGGDFKAVLAVGLAFVAGVLMV